MPPCPYGTKSKIQKLVMEDRMLAPVYTPSQNDVALEVGDVYRAKNYRIARVVTPQSHAVDYLLLNHIYYLRYCNWKSPASYISRGKNPFSC